MYKTSSLSYLIARKLVKTRFIGMPNILLDNEAAPEFIQHRATAEIISPVVENMLKKDNLEEVSGKFAKMRKKIEGKDAPEKKVFRAIEEETRENG